MHIFSALSDTLDVFYPVYFIFCVISLLFYFCWREKTKVEYFTFFVYVFFLLLVERFCFTMLSSRYYLALLFPGLVLIAYGIFRLVGYSNQRIKGLGYACLLILVITGGIKLCLPAAKKTEVEGSIFLLQKDGNNYTRHKPCIVSTLSDAGIVLYGAFPQASLDYDSVFMIENNFSDLQTTLQQKMPFHDGVYLFFPQGSKLFTYAKKICDENIFWKLRFLGNSGNKKRHYTLAIIEYNHDFLHTDKTLLQVETVPQFTGKTQLLSEAIKERCITGSISPIIGEKLLRQPDQKIPADWLLFPAVSTNGNWDDYKSGLKNTENGKVWFFQGDAGLGYRQKRLLPTKAYRLLLKASGSQGSILSLFFVAYDSKGVALQTVWFFGHVFGNAETVTFDLPLYETIYPAGTAFISLGFLPSHGEITISHFLTTDQ